MSNEVLENIKSRRSVRTYTERQVSAGDLNLILEAAAYAPSGMNFQTWHFTAIQNAAVLTELNEKIKGAFAKSDDPHFCDDPDVRAFLTRLGIPENHRVYGCAALGYAPADAPVKEKKLAAGTVTVIR